jgi:NHL repeat-containing protein
MDDLLTDHDDPEKRIVDLERPSASSRRFVASAAPPSTKQMMKYTYLLMFGAMASLGAINMTLVLLGALVGSEVPIQVGGPVVFIAFLLGAMPAFGAFQRRMNRPKQVLIDVGSDGLTVSTKPGDVFSFADAQLGPWTLAGYGGTTKGTALHLRTGQHRFVLGGQDHRAASGIPVQAPPVDTVDAWLWAPEFDEFLAAVGAPNGLDARRPTPGQPGRCLLTPNPAKLFSSSFFGMFKNTATAMKLSAKPPESSVAVELGEDAISVIDLKTNAPIASAPIAHVTATPAESTRSVPRMGTLTTAVLVVRVADSQPLTIGCPDYDGPATATRSGSTKVTYRFAWRGAVRAEDEPAFVVSGADWLALVDKFGLATRLEDRATDGDAVAAAGGARLARPRRKLWIYGVVIAAVMFGVAPAMMFAATSITSNHQNKDDQLKADRLRPFALPFTGLRVPHGVAVDAAGNVYVTDTLTNRVLKLTAGSNTQTVLPFTGLDLSDGGVIDGYIAGVAVDAPGNVYVIDSGHHRVVKLAAGSSTQTVLPFKGMDTPRGVAVDSAGTVYVVADGWVLKLAAGSSDQFRLPSTADGASAISVAVDRSGNVYAGFRKTHRRGRSDYYLMKMAPGSDTWTTLPSPPDNNSANFSTGEQDLAVDTRGDVYAITSTDTQGVWKLAPGSDSWTQLPGAPRFIDPLGLAVDSQGYVYVTDHLGSRTSGGGNLLFGIWPMGSDDAQGFVLKLPAD